MKIKQKTIYAYMILLIACVIWGGCFVPQKTAMSHVGPLSYSFVRMFLGGFVLLAIALYRNNAFDKKTFKNGIILGLILGVSAAIQQIGLQYTTATNGGFITGLYLLFVPLQITLLERKKLNSYLWLGALLTFAGLGLLCLTNDLSISIGDLLILLCAALFTQHIIVADKVVNQSDFLNLAAIQFFVGGAFCMIAALITETNIISGSIEAWKEILYGGLLSIAFAHTAQLFAQRFIPPAQSALICSLEAVFAALAGWWFLSESLDSKQLIGCIMMFSGIIIAGIKSNEKKNTNTDLDSIIATDSSSKSA